VTIIDESMAGQRLDSTLAQSHADYSRQDWHNYISLGLVTINDKAVKPAYRVQVGDKLSCSGVEGYLAEEASGQPPRGYHGPDIPVVYEDGNIIVISKPAGVVAHGGDGVPYEDSVAACFAGKIEQDGSQRAGIVHRLDKDTSGVMVLARTTAASDDLKSQFKSRSVDKFYTALVWGRMQQPSARVELPLARHHSIPTQMSVSPDGKMAITEYSVEKECGDYSLLDIRLLTGRMHQIRVHMNYLGNPVVGDATYSRRPSPEGLSRQFLHARRIDFRVPGGKQESFEAPLPAELQGFLEGIEHA
jgi:23S rRNA pseudouridine1911/1915/1917 synthase